MAELGALFLAAFLAATLLPGSSEAALAASLTLGAAPAWAAITVATLGNTLGSTANWAIGRYGAHWRDHPRFPLKPAEFARVSAIFERWGKWGLFFSWLPFIGDPLTVVAGLLGTKLRWFFPLVLAGKLARYLVVAGVVSLF